MVPMDEEQAGPGGGRAQPQRLLLSMLGEFWHVGGEPLPSAFLVRLLGEVGLSPQNGRATVNRVARRGLIEASRRGRRTYYRITARGAEVLTEGYRRIYGFGAADQAWDGSWTFVSFSVPEARRETRHLLRTQLRWQAFAPLHDAVWVAVGDRSAAAEMVLEELAIRTATIIVGEVKGPPEGHPVTAWKLDELRGEFKRFIDWCEPIRRGAVSGEISPIEALRNLIWLVDWWRMLASTDPDLPAVLLPPDWPRDTAHQLFVDSVDELGPLAALRVRQLLALDAPDLAALVRQPSTASPGPVVR